MMRYRSPPSNKTCGPPIDCEPNDITIIINFDNFILVFCFFFFFVCCNSMARVTTASQQL